MEFETLLPWLIFATATFFIWALINFLSAKSTRRDERLDELKNPRSSLAVARFLGVSGFLNATSACPVGKNEGYRISHSAARKALVE